MEKPADKAAFLAGKQFSISIAAVCHEWYYGETRNIGSNLIVSQDSQGNMMEIGTVISLLLLLVGALNYGNTMAASLQSRKLTFAIMESLGMSDRQIRKLLVREGLLYAFFSIIITMTAGTLITYICFQAVNYTGIPFSVPALPLVCSGGLLVILCIGVPLLSYRRLRGNPSIVERLREYEE